MKKIFKILLSILIFVSFIYIVGYVLISIKGEDLLRKYLREHVEHEIEIGAIRFDPALTLHLKDFKIEGFIEAPYFKVGVDWLGILGSGKVALGELFMLEPKISIIREKQGIVIPWEEAASCRAFKVCRAGFGQQMSGSGSFVINRVTIESGNVLFTDKTLEDEFSIELNDLNLDVTNLELPDARRKPTRFSCSGYIPWKPGVTGNFSLTGWVDMRDKNMDAKLSFDKIDLFSLSAYAPAQISREKTGFQEVVLSINANFKAENNDLTIDGALVVEDVKLREILKDQDSGYNIIAGIIYGLTSTQGKLIQDFKYKTKLDNPRLNLSSLLVTTIIKQKVGDGAEGFMKEGIDIFFKRSGD